MELLSNLTWVAVTIALWALWFARRRDSRGSRLMPGRGLQLIALAVLTVILLPVISVTDDLHSCQNPAEVERSLRKSDFHAAPDAGPQSLPVALALLVSYFSASPLRTVAYVALDEEKPAHPQGYLRALWSRPPPVA